MNPTIIWMGVAFIVGGIARYFEEQLRKRFLQIALTNQFRGKDSEELKQMTSEWSLRVYLLMVLFVIIVPERAMQKLRNDLAKYREGKESC